MTPILVDIPDIFRELFKSFDFSKFFVTIESLVADIVLLITTNFVNIWHYLVISGVVSVCFPYMIFNFYHLSTCNVLHNFMGSNMNFSFIASIFYNFGKNVRYVIISVLTILPIKLLSLYLVIRSFVLLGSESLILQIFAPFIIAGLYVIMESLRVTIFSGWVPYMVVKNAGVATSLVNGVSHIRKRLPQIFANNLGITLTIILVNMFGVLTCGVSLIVTIPASFLLVATFNMVAFYTSTGLRFYVDHNNVFAPKKTEMVESFKIYKNLV